MALTLSSVNIASGETIRAAHVTQSVDALTGAEAYDITISGSLTVIGPTNITGSVGILNDLDVIGTLTTGELELTNLTVNGIADIATANIDAGIISASFTGSLLGTASYALNAISSSFASSASRAISASWAPTAPAGNNTEIQFNSGSKLEASSNFKFDYTIWSLNQSVLGNALGTGSFVRGNDCDALGDFSYAAGFEANAYGHFSNAVGNTTQASGEYSYAQGWFSQALGTASHAEGQGTTQAIGFASHAEGDSTQAIGNSSHTEGDSTKTGITNAYSASVVSPYTIILDQIYGDVSYEYATNNRLFLYDIPFGGFYGKTTFLVSQSYFDNINSVTVIEVYDTLSTSTTAYVGNLDYGISNWIGDKTIPGDYSHTEGQQTYAIGNHSHAEGYEVQAIGNWSHAEGAGLGNQAIGNGSHTEGVNTKAIGNYSHAEGYETQAIGEASHAEGYYTIASGNYSHAEGYYTITSGSYQTVVGQYNAQNNTTDRFIVGTGTVSSRKDGFSVTHSGSIIVSTQSAAPTWTGREGEIVPVNVSGTYRIYVYIGGAWRSASLS